MKTFLLLYCFLLSVVFPQNNIPDGFEISYRWSSGSLPPKYHYYYTITINQKGVGNIALYKGYSGNVVWSEEFSVSQQDILEIWVMIKENEIFSRNWKEPKALRVGGSEERLIFTTSEQTIELPRIIVPDDEKIIAPLVSSIKQLVPESAWNCLQAEIGD